MADLIPKSRIAVLTLTLASLSVWAADAPKTKPELRKELRQKLLAAKDLKKETESISVVTPGVTTEPPRVDHRPSRKNASDIATVIDQQIASKLAQEKIPSSPRSTDEEFLRRVYLDIIGVIPPLDKVREFLNSTDPDKRAKLIDALLDDTAYGRHQADLWEPRLIPTDSNNRFVPRQPFTQWLTDRFNDNTPWDRFVYDIVTATGTIAENPAVSYFQLNRSIDKLTDGVSRNFLGLQLQCAQCHNHPFTGTKQVEYWGMAAFFSKLQLDRPANPNQTGKDNMQLVVREGPTKSRQREFFPESTKTVPPKYLEGEEPKLALTEPYRPALAKWLTSPENPYFAKAMVNRTWGELFGRGIVDPIDDLNGENEPTHPELLDQLTKLFVESGFDVKNLIRGICLSETYQRSSKTVPGNESDTELYSHRSLKVMTAEQLFDSIAQVIGFSAMDDKTNRGQAPAAFRAGALSPRQLFVQFYLAGAETANVREYEAGIPQVLKLMNSRMTGGSPLVVRNLVGPGMRPAEMIEILYLSTLSRKPTPRETTQNLAYIMKAKTPLDGLSDILWAVLNSSEFSMIR